MRARGGEIDGVDDTGEGEYRFCEDFRDSLIFGRPFFGSSTQTGKQLFNAKKNFLKDPALYFLV